MACEDCDAASPTASDRSAHIVYALYGPSHGRHLEVWNRTWLSGKRFVYVPDAPKGPFAANFRGVHAREKRGASNPASRYRFISDANMLWAAHIANRAEAESHPFGKIRPCHWKNKVIPLEK